MKTSLIFRSLRLVIPRGRSTGHPGTLCRKSRHPGFVAMMSIMMLCPVVADVVVTTAVDENNGTTNPGTGTGTSLREAVLHSPAGSTIVFAPALAGTSLNLTAGKLTVSKNLTINGSALSSPVQISGQNSSRIFEIQAGRTVSLIRLNLVNGKVTGNGGAILNSGTLTLDGCEVSANRASDGGGAIENNGTLSLIACTLSGNVAGVGGGAIEHTSGVLTVTNCTFTGNSAQWGGAIDGDGTSTIRLHSCTVSGNHASDKGGGIEETTGTLVLENSIVAGNSANNTGPDLKVSSINSQLGVNLVSSTNGLGGSFAGIVAAPLLEALGNFGGRTRTMPPQPGSPAINAGGATALALDQRGFTRVVGGATDIGSVEIQASLIVTNIADSGAGSLRNTVGMATPGTTIVFASSLDHSTILLTGGTILLDKSLTIDASARVNLKVSGNLNSAIFRASAGSIVKILNLDLIDGSGVDGGAIENSADLRLEDCSFEHCIADRGGALFNHTGGVVDITNCDFTENSALINGGALRNEGQVTMSDTRMLRNSSEEEGGAVSNPGTFVASDSVFGENEAFFFAGAIDSEGVLTMTRCSVEGNFTTDSGGGIASRQATLTACTIAENIGLGSGGGIAHGGAALKLVSCTIQGNRALDFGGGIATFGGTLEVVSSTISGNDGSFQGGGINAFPAGHLTLANSIVADNLASETGPDILGAIASQVGVNLVSSIEGISTPFTGLVASAKLSSLADFGGPTRTMHPLPGSPAINAGGTTALVTDQRGLPRVVGSLDIGSVEVQPAIIFMPGDVLREVVNAAPNGSTITFDPAMEGGTITVHETEGGDPDGDYPVVIDKNLIIDATNLTKLTIRQARHSSIMRILGGATVWVGGVDFRGSWGPAIDNQGDLTLDQCKVAQCLGGGLVNGPPGRLSIFNSVVSQNSGTGVSSQGALNVADSLFMGNHGFEGGAIWCSGGLTMVRSTVEGNTAGNNGAGVHVTSGGGTIGECTISGNHCFEGEGAGIYHSGVGLTVRQCTIKDNVADLGFGGGISSDSALQVDSCTITANAASFEGGGMHLYPSASLTLLNSIVAPNLAPVGPDISGAITLQGGVNLISDTGGLTSAFTGIVGDPELGPLALNGGPTLTCLPLAGSPAIDAGGLTTLTSDQRGFPRVVGAAADIGAVETGTANPVILVNTTADEDDGINSGNISLRDAMSGGPAGSVISFAAALNGKTITLTKGQLEFDRNMIIDATALPGGLTVTGGVVRGFEVDPGRHGRISGLSISGIESPFELGAAVLNSGDLELVRCTLSGNIAGAGGAIYNDGGLRLQDCILTGNDTILSDGGGLFNAGEAVLANCRMDGNGSVEGGAGAYNVGTLSMTDCEITSNSANFGGGGVENREYLEIDRCTFAGNRSEGGFGGGLLNSDEARVTNSTFTANQALDGPGGAGIANSRELAVVSCTISGNTTSDQGGGVLNTATGSLHLENSIVAGNTADSGGPDLHGAILVQAGVNLLGDTNGVTVPFTGIVANPSLAPLGNNGGPTRTMLPLTGSPAIDAGGTTALTVDQRGLARVVGVQVDIGSVETGNVPPGLMVNTTVDENDGIGAGNVSLRDAIAASSPGETVSFAASLNGQTILLSVGPLIVGKDLRIDASNLPGGVSVSGNNSLRVFDVQAGKTVAMTRLRVINGRNSGDGGGIRNAGNLTLDQCAVSANRAGDDGGGIYSSGSLVLHATLVTGNVANDSGGGIVSQTQLALSSCTLHGNTADNGGAIYNDGDLTIEDSTLTGNLADDLTGGGAIDNDGGEVLITRSTLAGNTSHEGGGAIENDGSLTILASTFSGNTATVGGGAIEHAAGILSLTSCTLAGNSAKYGGAIDGDGTSTIRLNCCTVSTNHASDKGGGIEETTGTLVLENSIVANNTATNSGRDLKASSINQQLGVNLVSNTEGLGGSFSGILANPMLSALANNGGPTETMVPVTGSPAIDAGGPTTLVVDQRGLPRMDGRWIDIGAVEVQDYLLVTSANDSGAGSLRTIIGLARSGSLIPFAPHLSGQTISLTSGPLVIAKNLDIDASALTHGVNFTGSAVRAFDVGAGTQVTIQGITVSDFISPDDDGAAVRNAGQLALTACTFTGNTGSHGGGIHNAATGQLSMTRCVLHDNEGQDDGGGLSNWGTAELTGCAIAGNGSSANGAGISNTGSLILADSSLSDNWANTVGGGLENLGTATITRCTFSHNVSEAGFGGGVENSGTLALVNCTLAGNEARVDGVGGGIGNSGGATLSSCTLSQNKAYSAGGIFNGPAGTLILGNTIVAGNQVTVGGPDIEGAIQTQVGVNLLGSTVGVTTAFTGIAADPLLDCLAVHGGPTLTMPPLAGSPAINAGGATALTVDQRGFTRVVGGALDIGAVETGNAIPSVIVNTNADENNGIAVGNVSLREAMAAVAPGTIIDFAPALNGQTFTLTLGQLVVDRNLIIDATPLADGITVTGEELRGFKVTPGRGLGLFGVTISGMLWDETGPFDTDNGGAVLNDGGYLEMGECALTGNTTIGRGSLYNSGHLGLADCVFHDNEATGDGGAFANGGSGYAQLTGCSFTSNGSSQNAAGIFNQGTLSLTECLVSGGSANFVGGGLYNSHIAILDRCTIAGNLAEGGFDGGISNSGNLEMTNSTVSGNTAFDGASGGIGNSGSLSLNSCTVTANSGGGIDTTFGDLNLTNSIIASNFFSSDLTGEIASEGGVNLLGSLSGVVGPFAGIVANPLLGPLADNGGPTPTHLPQAASPAINAGGATELTVDQRGYPRVVGGTLDIGSVETVTFSDTFSGPSPLDPYTIENPSPGPHSPMTIGVNGGELTFDYLSGFGVVAVNLDDKLAFLDTSLECDIRFESALGSDPRGSGGIAWFNGSSANGYLALGLQLDENRVYIFAYDGVTSTFTSGPFVLDRNTNYRTRLQVEAPGVIKAYVNDQLVTSLTYDISLLPSLMNPSMSGNSQAALRIVHDNFLGRGLD